MFWNQIREILNLQSSLKSRTKEPSERSNETSKETDNGSVNLKLSKIDSEHSKEFERYLVNVNWICDTIDVKDKWY